MYDNGSYSVNTDTYAEGKTTISQPTNGGDGDVYGLELQLRQKFSDLPGLLDGLGAGVNVTRQWTASTWATASITGSRTRPTGWPTRRCSTRKAASASM
ncbi:hypothetical protein ACRAWD_00935 [Caulobacter segnis]